MTEEKPTKSDSSVPADEGERTTANFPQVDGSTSDDEANASLSTPSLVVASLDGTRVVPIGPTRAVVLGRSLSTDIPVSDPSISRRHARFWVSAGSVWVEDMQSRHGTRINGRPLTGPTLVAKGDEVHIGTTTILVRHSAANTKSAHGLVNHERLVALLTDDIERARVFSRTVGLMMISSAPAGEDRFPDVLGTICSCLRPVDRAGMYGPNIVEVVVPEARTSELERLASRIRLTATGIPLRFGIAVFPHAARTCDDVIGVCLEALGNATDRDPIRRAPELMRRVLTSADDTPTEGSEKPVAGSSRMREIFAEVARVAATDLPVLILGETGTGKEVLARAIHLDSPRRDQPMQYINCAAIPDTLIDSTLFGYERGAFTGADRQTKGVFEAATRSTLLLDEVSELSPRAQAGLLRVLETKQFNRVGGTKPIAVDVRVVAATNRDLEQMCATGSFRQDLLFRLNAFTVTLPPLRDRVDDIPPLVERFLTRASRANARGALDLQPQVMTLLQSYTWPGNVRELRNVVERAVVVARDHRITVSDLPERIRAHEPVTTTIPLPPIDHLQPLADIPMGDTSDRVAPSDDFKSRMQQLETRVILDALRESGWNQSKAARRLKMPLRTLTYKMRAYGIRRQGYALDDSSGDDQA